MATPTLPSAKAMQLLSSTYEDLTDMTIPPDYVLTKDDRPGVPHDAFTDDIPVISLASLDVDQDGHIESGLTVRHIAKACEEWGVFLVVDHGVCPELLWTISRLSREFFALPADEKLRHQSPDAVRKGGFVVSGGPYSDNPPRDWREFFAFITYPAGSRDYTRWPGSPNGWVASVEEYSEAVMEVANRVLGLVSEAMGLEKGAVFGACCSGGEMAQKIVVNYFPKCPQPELTLGIRRHTDPSTITLVLQDDVGGLQVTLLKHKV